MKNKSSYVCVVDYILSEVNFNFNSIL